MFWFQWLNNFMIRFPTRGLSLGCALSQWCHPTISSSVIPFSSCPKSFQHQGLCISCISSSHQVARVLEFQLQHQPFQWIRSPSPCSAHKEIIWPCPPVWIRDAHTPFKGWPFPGRCFTRLKTLSLYFPPASPSLFCLLTLVPHCVCLSDSTKETGIPTDWQGGFFWGTSLPSSQSARSLNKVLSLS